MPWACCLPSFAQNGFGKKGRWHTMKYPTLNQFDNNSGWNDTLCKSTNQNRMNMGSWRFMSLYYKSSYPPTSTKRHYRPRVWGVVLVRVWVDRVPKTRLAKKPQSDPLNLCSFCPQTYPIADMFVELIASSAHSSQPHVWKDIKRKRQATLKLGPFKSFVPIHLKYSRKILHLDPGSRCAHPWLHHQGLQKLGWIGPWWSGRNGWSGFDPDLLGRYTEVAWYECNLSFLGMDHGHGGLWIACPIFSHQGAETVQDAQNSERIGINTSKRLWGGPFAALGTCWLIMRSSSHSRKERWLKTSLCCWHRNSWHIRLLFVLDSWCLMLQPLTKTPMGLPQ